MGLMASHPYCVGVSFQICLPNFVKKTDILFKATYNDKLPHNLYFLVFTFLTILAVVATKQIIIFIKYYEEKELSHNSQAIADIINIFSRV